MGALIKGGSESASASAYLRDKSYAHWVAQNRVTELQLTRQWLSQGNHKGSSKMAGKEWFWIIKVSNTFDADVQRIDVGGNIVDSTSIGSNLYDIDVAASGMVVLSDDEGDVYVTDSEFSSVMSEQSYWLSA